MYVYCRHQGHKYDKKKAVIADKWFIVIFNLFLFLVILKSFLVSLFEWMIVYETPTEGNITLHNTYHIPIRLANISQC